jgi:protein gp37
MSGATSIEWATKVWNPTVGCTRVSAGCDNCYAFKLHDQRHIAWKRGRMQSAAKQYHLPFSKVQLLPARLEDPRGWRDPQRVFVDSMADLMHPAVPDSYLDQVFATMDSLPRHTFQLLTKRPERFVDYIARRYRGAPAPAWIWLGTSIEDDRVLERVDRLRETPATVRFLSCEPLVGSLAGLDLKGIQWVIAGGESGPRRRPVDPDWFRELRDACVAAGVAFFFKQWGGFRPKDGGRELDGRTWDQFPNLPANA